MGVLAVKTGVETFKFLDSKSDNANGGYNQPTQNTQQYQAPQEQYAHIEQQPSYNNNMQQGAGMTQQPQQIPEINIDEDEIPF